MLGKTTLILGALATQGVLAQIKPVDQATRDGHLNATQVQTVEQMCGSLAPDESSNLPCTIEQTENAKLVANAKVVDKKSPAAARAWFEQWKKSERFHSARDCCVQCKVEAGHKGIAAGLTPNQAKWVKDTLYNRERYVQAWEKEQRDFTLLMDEWTWRNQGMSWPAITNQTEAAVGYVKPETCGTLSGQKAVSVAPAASNQTVVFPTMPNIITTFANPLSNITVKGDGKPNVTLETFCQPRFVAAQVDGGKIDGRVFEALASRAAEGSSVKVAEANIPSQAIPKEDCQACVKGSVTEPIAQIVGQGPSKSQMIAIKTEISIHGVSNASTDVLIKAKGTSSAMGNSAGMGLAPSAKSNAAVAPVNVDGTVLSGNNARVPVSQSEGPVAGRPVQQDVPLAFDGQSWVCRRV